MLGDPLTFNFLWYTLGPSVVPDSLAHHLDFFGFSSHLILCISTFTRFTCIRTATLDVATTPVYSVKPYCDGYRSPGISYVVWINKDKLFIVCPVMRPDYQFALGLPVHPDVLATFVRQAWLCPYLQAGGPHCTTGTNSADTSYPRCRRLCRFPFMKVLSNETVEGEVL